MRVLQVVTYMGRGGLETMLMNYYRHMDRKKVQFDFLVHRDFEADYDAEILALGGKIWRLPRLNPLSPDYRRQLSRFFRDHPEYRIVHSHLDCMAGVPLDAARKNGVPVRIAHAHNSSQTRDLKYLLKLWYKQGIRRQATHLFACGRSAGEWMFCTEDFQILNNAVDASRYAFDRELRAQVRQELGIEPAARVIGHVGRFSPQKNHSFLLDLFAKLPPNHILLLVGDGELRNSSEVRAMELGIRDRVIFAGVRSDVERLLQAMDVFVFPSVFEGLPVSVIEAQAAGLPCLISDKVPIECKITDLVRQVPLDAGAEAWAVGAGEAELEARRDTLKEIRAAGFDIRENAHWLQCFYMENDREGKG